MFKVIENKKSLKICPIKYSSDSKMENIHPSLPNTPFLLYICGKPKSGKTCLLMNLITQKHFYKQRFDKIFVFSPSIFSGNMKDNVLLELPEDQRFLSTEGGNLEEVLHRIKNEYKNDRILLIFDDIQHELKGENLKLFLQICNNRRHITTQGVYIILTSQQYIGSVDLKIRKCISNLVFFSSKNRKELKAVYDEYLSWLSIDQFSKLLKLVFSGSSHNFLFLDTYSEQSKMLFKNFQRIEINE